jgi:hypothetical protein
MGGNKPNIVSMAKFPVESGTLNYTLLSDVLSYL